jgi:hypothetical protein
LREHGHGVTQGAINAAIAALLFNRPSLNWSSTPTMLAAADGRRRIGSYLRFWHFLDMAQCPTLVRYKQDCVAKLRLMRIANHDSVGGDGIGGSGA